MASRVRVSCSGGSVSSMACFMYSSGQFQPRYIVRDFVGAGHGYSMLDLLPHEKECCGPLVRRMLVQEPLVVGIKPSYVKI